MKTGAIIGYGIVGIVATLYGVGFFMTRKKGFARNKFFATIYGLPVATEKVEEESETVVVVDKPKVIIPEFKKNDIVLAKNDTTIYTAPPRNIGERDKYRMGTPRKGANIGWFVADDKKLFGTFYSKVKIRLKGGAYKTVYMPKRDIKIK